MNADERSRYFQELNRNLQHEGFTVKPETEDGLLPVEMEGQRLCQVTETGAVRYWKADVSGGVRREALNQVTDIARTTAGSITCSTVYYLRVYGTTPDSIVFAHFLCVLARRGEI